MLYSKKGWDQDTAVKKIAADLDYPPNLVEDWAQGYLPNTSEIKLIAGYFASQLPTHRRWVELLIGSSKASDKEQLLDDLYPERHIEWALRPPTTPHNLPTPLQAIDLHIQEIPRVLEGLQSRYPIVAITGRSGIGKSTVALHAAHQALLLKEGPFEWAVYMSFKRTFWNDAKTQKNGSRDIDRLITILAQVLGASRFSLTSTDRKVQLAQAFKVLRDEKILLVLDDVERLSHGFKEFLYSVPEPSKALLTSRYRLLDYAWNIEIDDIGKTDYWNITSLQAQKLNIDDVMQQQREAIEELAKLTHYNPFISKALLAYLYVHDDTLRHVLNSFRTDTKSNEEVALALLNRVWGHFTTAQQHILQSFLLFPESATKEAIGIVSNTTKSLNIDLEELVKIGLLSVYSTPLETERYTVQPITLTFLRQRTDNTAWRTAAQARLLQWFTTWVVEQNKKQWNNTEAHTQEAALLLQMLDYVERHPNDVTEAMAIALHRLLVFKGLWAKCRELTTTWIQRFSKSNNTLQTAVWLRSHLDLLNIEQSYGNDAITDLKEIEATYKDNDDLLDKTNVYLYLGQVYLSFSPPDLDEAQRYLTHSLKLAKRQGNIENQARSSYQLAIVALKRGLYKHAIAEFEQLYYKEPITSWRRAKVYISVRWADALIQNGNLADAITCLNEAHLHAPQAEPLLYAIVLMERAKLEYALSKGDIEPARHYDTARRYAEAAIDIYRQFQYYEIQDAETFLTSMTRRQQMVP